VRKVIESLLTKVPVLRPWVIAAKQTIRFRRNVSALKSWTVVDDKRRLFYGQFISPGVTVFDIGANVGNRVKIFSALGATVVAFEPQPSCISVLKKGFSANDNVTIVPKAVGAKMGSAKMLVSDAHTLSSMSNQWIAAVKDSGRFGHIKWDEPIEVGQITLENAIETYGAPEFTKIDVEGYELEVLKGLKTPISFLSFEFTPEYLENADQCIDLLVGLGKYEFQISLGETMEFYLDDWICAADLKARLAAFSTDIFADVYARLRL
jgi:FkbM family methyltransferase